MDTLFLNHTEDTPKVVFNKYEGIFLIEGRSLPENAVAFYLPLLDWVQKYSQAPNSETYFDIRLDYFNTASAKQITKLLLAIQELAQKNTVKVRWYYLKEDTDIMSSGARFSKLIKANIELVEYE